ncbi:hypothetical protein SBA4_20019 [Candidatus Sulfopaludibacter sp. SbA4]|nr:hypothetical protein SBA4_20019 [Candidatus Sulfopaludibacter sp. SbA4]
MIVSAIVACRNEARHIRCFLDLALAQQLPEAEWEIIVADGMSDDGTRQVLEEYRNADRRVRVIDNPGQIVSTGLNAAIRVARGEIVVRLDAHTEYAPDYLQQCVAALEATGADNVGGPARTRASGLVARVIAAAYHSPFACGGARFHDEEFERRRIRRIRRHRDLWLLAEGDIGAFGTLRRGARPKPRRRTQFAASPDWRKDLAVSGHCFLVPAPREFIRLVQTVFSVRLLESCSHPQTQDRGVMAPPGTRRICGCQFCAAGTGALDQACWPEFAVSNPDSNLGTRGCSLFRLVHSSFALDSPQPWMVGPSTPSVGLCDLSFFVWTRFPGRRDAPAPHQSGS